VPAEQHLTQEGPAFTTRSLLLGCLCVFGVSAGATYGTLYLKGSFMALGTSMPGAVFLLFLLTFLINPLLKLVHPPLGLRRGELLVIYIMMVMASPIPTLFAARFLRTITHPFYFATVENEWSEWILPYIPDWMMPHNPRVAELFFEGGAQGESVPWDALLPVLIAWMPFIWAIFLLMITTMILLRKQWVDHERLIYPLMQVPLAMTQEGQAHERLAPFFKNPVMWAGFALPAVWGTLHGLYNYFPAIVPVARGVDPMAATLSIFPNMVDLVVLLRFNILGFFYFLKTDIAFSLWFFNLLSYAVRGIFANLGIVGPDVVGAGHAVRHAVLAHQAMGAMLVLFGASLWMARGHLRAALRRAFWGDGPADDADEILSYRAAFVLLGISSLVIVGWLSLAGLPLWYGLLLLLLAVTIIAGYARVVAEGGLSDGSPPVVPAGILVSAVGSSAIGAPGLVVLATAAFWTTGRNFVMVSCANSLRLGEELPGSRRPLFWVMLLALAVALGGALWTVVTLSHAYGAINLWLWGGEGFGYAERLLRSPTEANGWSWLHTGIGATIMLGLMVARWFYLWWPLHPLGYAIGPIWIMDHLWFNMLLAWLIKIGVLKYGGVRLYLKTRPFFFGLILGYYTPGGVYLVIDHFTGMIGNVIFWG
jgi:hypothetical protein